MTQELIFHFLLIFTRIIVTFINYPGFNSGYLNKKIKIFLAVAISLAILPSVKSNLPKYNNYILMNIISIFIEIILAIIISIAANIYFSSLHYLGQIIAMQSTLSSATFFDQKEKSQVAIFTNFILIIVTTVILSNDIDHIFIKAIVDSYNNLSIERLLNAINSAEFISLIINNSFIFFFKMASPFIIVNMAIMLGSGLLSRFMPNLQVFFVITPGQILLILTTLYIVLQTIVSKIVTIISQAAIGMY